MLRSLVGSEMCIRDSGITAYRGSKVGHILSYTEPEPGHLFAIFTYGETVVA